MSPKAAWLLVNEIIPRLKNTVPNAVNSVGCEDAEELIQDATVTAAKLLTSVEWAGKTVTPEGGLCKSFGVEPKLLGI